MPLVVGIKFKQTNKVYYFSPESIELAEGDGVIVETARGVEFGKVAFPPREVEEKKVVQPLKPIMRKATDDDLRKVERNEVRKPEAIKTAAEKVRKHNLDMKLVDAEYTFDGNKLVIYFTAEGRVDFRELVKDLAAVFKLRIELRQIGIRDECKMRGGLAPCGRVCCCSNHLGDYGHVSIKMAKNQGLSLNPAKISGLCGRLMCCLGYENEHYAQTAKRMPKINSDVTTPDGVGTVVYNNMLKELVRVKMPAKDGFEIKEYALKDVNGKVTLASELNKRSAEDENLERMLK